MENRSVPVTWKIDLSPLQAIEPRWRGDEHKLYESLYRLSRNQLCRRPPQIIESMVQPDSIEQPAPSLDLYVSRKR